MSRAFVGRVQERNFYKPGQKTPEGAVIGSATHNWTIPEMWAGMKRKVDFEKRKRAVSSFNAQNRWRKRGIAMTPVRCGMHGKRAAIADQKSLSVILPRVCLDVVGSGMALAPVASRAAPWSTFTWTAQCCWHMEVVSLGRVSTPRLHRCLARRIELKKAMRRGNGTCCRWLHTPLKCRSAA